MVKKKKHNDAIFFFLSFIFSFSPPSSFLPKTSQRCPSRDGDLGPGHVRRAVLAEKNKGPRLLRGHRRPPHRVVAPERLELVLRERRDDERRQHGPGVDGVEPDAVLRGELGRQGLDERGERGL